METIHDFEMTKLHDSYDYEITREMINNLPLLYWPEEKKLKDYYDKNVCKDFLDSLIWTSHYYFKECIDWRWCTKYDNTPSLIYLSKYIENMNTLSIDNNDNEYNEKELLKFIFPNESHKLHNYDIISNNYKLFIEPYYHRYFWECPIKFV